MRRLVFMVLACLVTVVAVPASPAEAATFRSAAWPWAWASPLDSPVSVSTNYGAWSRECPNADTRNGYSYYLETGRSEHLGLDLAAGLNTPVRAIATGRVLASGALWGSGNKGVVLVEHRSGNGDTFTAVYGHLSIATSPRTNTTWKAGDLVRPGDVMGGVANPGGGAHLHFGIAPGSWTVVPGSSSTPGSGNCAHQPRGTVDPEAYLAARVPDTMSNPVAAEANRDGRLELFGTNSHIPNGRNNIFQRWQTSPGGTWSGWTGVPGYLTSVAVARNKDGRLEQFGVNEHIPDGRNNIFHRWQTSPGGTWSGWTGIPGYLTSIAAETNQDGRIEVFGANEHIPDGRNNIFHRWQTSPGGSWSGWTGIPGYLTTVAVARNRDGRLELFGVNEHIPDGRNNIFQRWQTSPGGSWSGWTGVVGYLTAVAAETNQDGRIEVFGANEHIPDGRNNIFHRWQTSPGGSWSSWSGVAGYLTSVAVARNRDGRLEVFGSNEHIADGRNNVFHSWQTSPGGTWSGWSGIPGYLA